MGGKHTLRTKKREVWGGMKLKKDEDYKVRELIREKLLEQLKLPFGLWTRKAIQQLISERFGVELSRWQAGRYLKKRRYMHQKPIRKAFKQKPENVKRWLEEGYPAKEKWARAEGDHLFR